MGKESCNWMPLLRLQGIYLYLGLGYSVQGDDVSSMLDFLDWLATLLGKVACLFPSCLIGFGLLVYVMDFFFYIILIWLPSQKKLMTYLFTCDEIERTS